MKHNVQLQEFPSYRTGHNAKEVRTLLCTSCKRTGHNTEPDLLWKWQCKGVLTDT